MQRRGVTPNDNGSVIQMLSKKMGAYNRSRNRLLLGAVVLSIVSLTVVFGLAYGRAQAEYQRGGNDRFSLYSEWGSVSV